MQDIDLHGVETDTVAISPGGAIFAGNDEGRIAIMRDGRTRMVDAHEAGIKRVVLDHRRSLLVTLSYDRTMRLWSVAGDELTPLDVAVLPDDVWPRSCAFADGTTLVFATFGATDRTYDYERRAWEAGAIAPTLGRNAVLPLAEGTYSVGDAGIVWRDDAVCTQLGSPHTHSIKCVVASADRRSIATGSYDGRIAIYDRERDGWSVDVRPTTAGISSLSFDPRDGTFAASSYDGTIYRVPDCRLP